jgi:hypothetical protein
VVQPLSFRRRTLSSELLWQPLPEARWQSRSTAGGERMNPPPHVLRHRALLTLPDGRPISLVVETYTREALPERP